LLPSFVGACAIPAKWPAQAAASREARVLCGDAGHGLAAGPELALVAVGQRGREQDKNSSILAVP